MNKDSNSSGCGVWLVIFMIAAVVVIAALGTPGVFK